MAIAVKGWTTLTEQPLVLIREYSFGGGKANAMGTLLYAGDYIANFPKLPKNFVVKWIFKLSDSGPGLKVFNLFFKFFVEDRAAARDFLIREIETHPPSILAPAHGDVVQQSDLGPTLISLLRRVS